MPDSPNAVPVFSVVRARRSYAAFHPDSTVPADRVAEQARVMGQDTEHPVGTAVQQQDGSFLIQLTALPLDGVIVVRLPQG